MGLVGGAWMIGLVACASAPAVDAPAKASPASPSSTLVRVEPLVDVRAFSFRQGAPSVASVARGTGASEGATLLGESAGEPLHGLLHDGGLIAVIGPEATLAGALARMSEQTQPDTTLLGLSGVTRSRLLTGQTWSTLLEGQSLTLPGDSATGATRLLARCWPAPDVTMASGEPADGAASGGLRQVMVVDLVPLLARARGAEGFSLEAPSLRTPADRGLALTTYRLRVHLRTGQALLIAPAVQERGAPTQTIAAPDVPALGEVRRESPAGSAAAVPPASSSGAPAQRGSPGPRTQRPLLLGEALMSDATVDRTAVACTVLLLTPAPLPPGAPASAQPGYGLAR
jgi:hypothetical protein